MLSALGKLLVGLLVLVIGLGVYLYVLAPQTAYDWGTQAERSLAGLTEKQVEVGRFNMHYLIGGSGEPLVLVHGFGADKDNWTRMAGDLSGEYRIIAPDLPGFGESDHPQGVDYGYAAQVERLHEFVQTLGLGPVHIAGNSMGGAIAGLYAATYPEQTRSLWLLAPAGVASAPPSDLFRQLEAGGRNPLLPTTTEEFYTLLDDWVFAEEPYIPAPIKYVLAERAVEREPLLRQIFNQITASDLALEQRLAGSSVPTLVLWGEQDRLLHPAGARILADAVANATLIVMPDTGHAPMLERPRRSARAFEAFERGLDDSAPQAAAN